MNPEEIAHHRAVEARRVLHDYLKHVATLSTGSILIIVTFLEKLSEQPTWTWLVAVTIIAFAICIIATIVAQVGNFESLTIKVEPDELNNLTFIAMLLTWACFSIGVISMVIFGVANLM